MDNREAFRSELITATLAAAREAASKFSAEGLYSFALYTSGEYNYVFASVATQAGLEQVATRYLTDERFRRAWGDHAGAMQHLKWSPCDSPHHAALQDGFHAAYALLDALWDECEDDLGDEDDDEEVDDEYSQLCDFIHQTFAEALLAVRHAKIFTDAVTLNILMGDQGDDDRISNAETLNEPALVEQLRTDLERLDHNLLHED